MAKNNVFFVLTEVRMYLMIKYLLNAIAIILMLIFLQQTKAVYYFSKFVVQVFDYSNISFFLNGSIRHMEIISLKCDLKTQLIFGQQTFCQSKLMK